MTIDISKRIKRLSSIKITREILIELIDVDCLNETNKFTLGLFACFVVCRSVQRAKDFVRLNTSSIKLFVFFILTRKLSRQTEKQNESNKNIELVKYSTGTFAGRLIHFLCTSFSVGIINKWSSRVFFGGKHSNRWLMKLTEHCCRCRRTLIRNFR